MFKKKKAKCIREIEEMKTMSYKMFITPQSQHPKGKPKCLSTDTCLEHGICTQPWKGMKW